MVQIGAGTSSYCFLSTHLNSLRCHTRESAYIDPSKDPAKIRAFFVHPSHARKGLARALLEYCEQQAKSEGFSKIEMRS